MLVTISLSIGDFSIRSIAGPDNTSTPDYMTLEDMRAVLDQVPLVVTKFVRAHVVSLC